MPTRATSDRSGVAEGLRNRPGELPRPDALEGVLILILYVSEEVQRLPGIFAHLLEEYVGLRVLVIAGPLSESSITAYWMSLVLEQAPGGKRPRSARRAADGIRFVANLDPSQDDIPPRLAAT
ncbi:MAG: hypothetical protein U0521_22640 [Anaerolineae bacterium]